VASESESLGTIYFGGGTPSLLPADAIASLLHELALTIRNPQSAIRNRSNPQSTIRNDTEITIEANPEDVTVDSARAWRTAGINRVSLGAQSFDDAVLKWMHRSHDAARIGGAVHALRGAGIDNISLDLIFALPDELHRDWERDLDMALAVGEGSCHCWDSVCMVSSFTNESNLNQPSGVHLSLPSLTVIQPWAVKDGGGWWRLVEGKPSAVRRPR